MKGASDKILRIGGVPSERQKKFFASRARYTAYGGARGGGKSWALRRKLIALCLLLYNFHDLVCFSLFVFSLFLFLLLFINIAFLKFQTLL